MRFSDAEFVFSIQPKKGSGKKLGIDPKPMIAMLGRSNVGKSSLINALCNRKSLARVSVTPGRTRELLFFNISNECYLVDMPGYGYAAVSLQSKGMWQEMIMNFLHSAADLMSVLCLLIDSRRGIGDSDMEIMSLMDEMDLEYWIIFTKCDKVAKSHDFLIPEGMPHENVFFTSSKDKEGIEKLRNKLEAKVKSTQL